MGSIIGYRIEYNGIGAMGMASNTANAPPPPPTHSLVLGHLYLSTGTVYQGCCARWLCNNTK